MGRRAAQSLERQIALRSGECAGDPSSEVRDNARFEGLVTTIRRWRSAILAGHGPLRFLAVVVALAFILIVVPWILRALNSGRFEAPVDAVRIPQFVEPYGEPAPIHEEDVTVWEPEWKEKYTPQVQPGGIVMGISYFPAKTTQTVVGDEPVEFEGGGRLRLAAIAVRTIPFDSTVLQPSTPVRLYDPDGKPMAVSDQEALVERTGVAKEQWIGGWRPGDTYSICFLLEEDGKPDYRGMTADLRDARTGWPIDYPTSPWLELHDGEMVRLRTYVFAGNSVAAGPADLHLTWLGPGVEVGIPSHPGTAVRHKDQRIFLRAIGRLHGGLLEIEGNDEQRDRSAIAAALKKDGNVALVFDALPYNLSELVAFDSEGDRVLLNSATRINKSGMTILTASVPANLPLNFKLLHRQRTHRAILKLPFLPELPKENRSVADFTDCIVSKATFRNGKEMENFLSRALQTRWASRPPVTTPQVTFENVTVGDILRHYRQAAGPHSIIQTSRHFNHTTKVEPPGTARTRHTPFRAHVLNVVLNGWKVLGILAATVLAFKVWALIQARRLKTVLRFRDYTDLTLWDTERLWLMLGRRAWRLPHRDELGTIPGVDPGDIGSIVRFVSKTTDR